MNSQGVDVQLVVPRPIPTSATTGPPPRTASPEQPPALARTGTELLAVLLIAVVLLVLGALLVQAGRSRRRHA